MSIRVGIVGAGPFGRGIAAAAARVGNPVTLVTRRDDVSLAGVSIEHDHVALREADVVFVAVPSPHIEGTARDLADHLDGRHLLVHVSRGLLGEELRTVSQRLRETTPCRRVGALAGPLVADALATGKVGGAIVGSHFPETVDAVREAIAGPTLRIYGTDDVVGVEVASAFVGVMSLAVGFAIGLGVGPSALAVVATQGMNEGASLGATLGADPRTFSEMAGMADLLSVVAGDRRPEFVLGELLAKGRTRAEAQTEAGSHVEGLDLAERFVRHAARTGVDVPICRVISGVLGGKLTPSAAIETLMARPLGRR